MTTTTISREQHAVATERVREAGLEDRVKVLLSDYRDLRGRFDKLVSIEMIEAVGWQYFDTFFRRCSELLGPDGLMLLQAITIDDRAYEVEKASRTFISELIFPSGCLPSLEVISRCVARATDMRDASSSRTSPATTPRRCGAGASASSGGRARRAARLRPRFRRLWELYFAYVRGGLPRAPDRGRADCCWPSRRTAAPPRAATRAPL